MAGGRRVEAMAKECCESGTETGGDEMVRVSALKLCPSDMPH
jgi:hypothetical protein